jgi:hypothetical protein
MIPKEILQEFVLKLQIEQADCVSQILERATLRCSLCTSMDVPPIDELMEEENKFFELYDQEDMENHMIDLYRHKTLSWLIKDLQTILQKDYGQKNNH